MSKLLVKPQPEQADGKFHDISPASAGWTYVGFAAYHLAVGQQVQNMQDGLETLLVLISGKAHIKVADKSLGELGKRMDIFDWQPPWSVYVPPQSVWEVEATTEVELGVCTAPCSSKHAVQVIEPAQVEPVVRGKDANTRHIHPIMMEERAGADSLLVTEVLTPQSNWSSYPPHKHDKDEFPAETLLEETYYHRINPKQGFGIQRVYTDNRDIDETVCFADQDVVLVPRGYHMVGAPYGYELYYLNVMAGPRRNWRFRNDADHDWIYRRDKP